MQVLLNSDVKNLGYRGDIVSVKAGYYRNFLMPQNLAKYADKKTVELAESRNEKRTVQKDRVMENAKEVLEKLKGLSIVIKAKVSDKGKLYAGVTETDVIAAVAEAGKVELEKEFVKMDHFKDLGEHKVLIHLGEDLEEEITVNVEALEE